MGRMQETFNKKDKKRKEKEQKRALKKTDGKKNGLDSMIAYVDEFGNITATPPDPDKKTVVIAENIEIKISKNAPGAVPDFVRKGVITYFNDSKGYGFIKDLESHQSIFVHINNLLEPAKENNIVVFEVGKGPKGLSAMKVKLFKE